MEKQKVDVVISGGSVEGICVSVGFLKAILVDMNCEIVSAAGNSAGGVMLGALASGNDIESLEKIALDTDFEDFVSLPSWWQFFKIYRVYRRGWLSDGKKFEAFLERLTKKKRFRDLEMDLHIAGANFNRYELHDFSKSSEPDMLLWKAMRITSALPVVFKPFRYKDYVWYDGGVRRHYPAEFVPESDRPFYGYLVGSMNPVKEDVETRPGILGTIADYVDQSVDSNVQDGMACLKRVPKTVEDDDEYVGTFDFGIDRKEKERLIEKARQNTLKVLKGAA